MAGIGFELRKILTNPGYTGILQAYTYAGMIGSGPWLIAVLCLALLGIVLTGLGSVENVRLFFISVSFVYAFTLIVTGPIQMVLNRYAADQQFTNRLERIFPAFIYSMAWTAALSAVCGLIIFVLLVPGPLFFRLCAAALTVEVALMWITGIFLTALKNYRAVIFGFACGFISSLFLSWGLARIGDIVGAIFGFVVGHAILLLVLWNAIFKELRSVRVEKSDFLSYFRKYWDLALAGLFYNLGIWMDKFLHWWFDPAAEQVAGILYASPIFDRVVYFSFLTIVPGMAVFLLKLETEFAEKNQLFFQLVLKKGTLAQILQVKSEMVESLRDSFALLLKVQGLFTGLLILCAPRILSLLGLGHMQAGAFQISLIGVFLLVAFLASLTILFYLDRRVHAMLCCLIFAVINTVVTSWGILAGERWFGFGFLLAAGTALFLSARWVNIHLHNLDYDTFNSQPIYG